MCKRPKFLTMLICLLFIFIITNVFVYKFNLINVDCVYAKNNKNNGRGNESNEDAGEAEAEAAEQAAEVEAEVAEAASEAAAEAAENTTTTVKKHKGKSAYFPKYTHSVRLRMFESDWITFDATSLAYFNDPNSRNRFSEVTTMVTFNLHKLWERRSKNKEMKENLTYAEEHYKLIQQEDSSWLIKEK